MPALFVNSSNNKLGWVAATYKSQPLGDRGRSYIGSQIVNSRPAWAEPLKNTQNHKMTMKKEPQELRHTNSGNE